MILNRQDQRKKLADNNIPNHQLKTKSESERGGKKGEMKREWKKHERKNIFFLVVLTFRPNRKKHLIF